MQWVPSAVSRFKSDLIIQDIYKIINPSGKLFCPFTAAVSLKGKNHNLKPTTPHK